VERDPAPADLEEVVGLLVSTVGGPPPPADAGPCPGEDALASFLEGEPPGPHREEVEAHLSLCPACRTVAAAASEAGGEGDAPSPPADVRNRFGPFTLVRRLGSGAMGDVYEAVHDLRKRREALKVLRGGLPAEARLAERFDREIAVMAGLEHEHVVGIWDAGVVDGELYYTMPVLRARRSPRWSPRCARPASPRPARPRTRCWTATAWRRAPTRPRRRRSPTRAASRRRWSASPTRSPRCTRAGSSTAT
jgi:hypothetical protein